MVATAARSRNGCPLATAACHRRAPSRWSGSRWRRATSTHGVEAVPVPHRPAGSHMGVLHGDGRDLRLVVGGRRDQPRHLGRRRSCHPRPPRSARSRRRWRDRRRPRRAPGAGGHRPPPRRRVGPGCAGRSGWPWSRRGRTVPPPYRSGSANISCRRLTVGSSPYWSSPTSASAMARRMAGVGRVTVSERRSTSTALTVRYNWRR